RRARRGELGRDPNRLAVRPPLPQDGQHPEHVKSNRSFDVLGGPERAVTPPLEGREAEHAEETGADAKHDVEPRTGVRRDARRGSARAPCDVRSSRRSASTWPWIRVAAGVPSPAWTRSASSFAISVASPATTWLVATWERKPPFPPLTCLCSASFSIRRLCA